ncbi:MAG TPA: DUF429 domain-containing protein [Marmoricola sp.]|nr:DUF429 domain-containing protein [Marmoricola sp.]
MTPWQADLHDAVQRGLAEAGPVEVLSVLEAQLETLATHPGTPVRPFAPETPVLGVDACSAGWVGVALGPAGRPTVHVGATIKALVAQVREIAEIRVVAIDIPIGLPDSGGRKADLLARAALPGKGASVFSTLTRAAYCAETYAEGREQNLAATDDRLSASAQAYALRAKILDVDAWVRDSPGVVVIEAHPELSFARMAGAPLVEPKKDPAGAQARRDALARRGIVAPAWFSGSGFAQDDLLDACAVAWTAARHAAGETESFPDEPEYFSDGLPAAIRV